VKPDGKFRTSSATNRQRISGEADAVYSCHPAQGEVVYPRQPGRKSSKEFRTAKMLEPLKSSEIADM
jgi:hypothetical protein